MMNKNREIQMEKLDKTNIEDILALTPMQEGMLFHYVKNPESNHYFEQLSLEISGKINREIFQKAWNFVIETNEMLRTVFRWQKVENPVQIVLRKHKLQLKYYDFSGKESKEKGVEEINIEDRKEKFDLQEVPFRVTLCKLEKSKYEMIISNHHILYDGWSNGIILREFFDAYTTLSNGKELQRPVKTKFREFVKWNQNRNIDNQEKFWKDYLKGFDTPTELSVKRRRKRQGTPSSGDFHISFPKNVTIELENFVKKHRITLASLLYAAWGILLQKYNDCDDVIFGTTVSGRSTKLKGIEEAVGLFINTLPLRVQTHHHEKILDFLSRTNEMVQQWETFEGSSTLNIKEYLDEDYGENLFNSVLVIENYPLDKILKQDIHTSILTLNGFSIYERTYHDLTVIITTFDDMMINLTYNLELFDEGMVKTLVEHFTLILKRMVEDPGQNVSVLEISPGEIRECIINKYAISPSQSTAEYSAPRDPLEKELVDIWSWIFRVGEKEIGIDTNFLDFGGHSLKAAALRSMIHKRLNVRIPFGQVFKCLTIREQAKFIRELKETQYIPIQPAERKEYYVLSPAQKRIFILQQMEETIVHYNGVEVFILEGNVERERLENTFRKLIGRHECLRTSFELRDETPVQRVHQTVEFKIDYGESGEDRVPAIIQDFIKPFRLVQAPLCRVKLLKVGEKRFALMVDMHHIISDGISIQVLLEDFKGIFEGKTLPAASIQYKDYADWQNTCSQKEKLKTQESYWLDTFSGEILPLNLYTDYSRPSVQDYKGDTIAFNFDSKATQKLSEFAIKTVTTIYMVLFSAFKVLLWKLTGQEDIVIGTPTAGRSHPDLDRVVGMFVNTLAIRSFPEPGKTFMQFVEEVKDNFIKAYENQDYPFEILVERLGLQGERSGNPLFDVWVNSPHAGEPGDAEVVFDDIKWIPYKMNHPFTKFDLSLYIREYGNNIEARLQYKISLFKPSTIQYLLDEYAFLVEEIINYPNKKLRDYTLFSRQRIPVEKNVITPGITYTRFEKEEINQSIANRFEKQVEKYPGNIAVTSANGDRLFTYSYLNKYVNKVARAIVKYFDDAAQLENAASSSNKTKVDKQTVALLFSHDIDIPVAIMGTLKCGRIYVPLDPTYPEQRLLYMLEDSEARLILTNKNNISLAKKLQDKTNQRPHTIEIDALDDGIPDENLEFSVKMDQIAYILYTSGSTGKPKGVIQSHRNVLHFIRVFTNNGHVNHNDNIPLISNYCFDGSVVEIFLALLNGATLHIYDIKLESSNLSKWLEKRKITVFHSTPTLYRHFTGSLREDEKVSSIRIIFLGGEPLYKKDVDFYKKYFDDNCILVASMGMTEATANLQYLLDKHTALPHHFVPLGYPVEETKVFILDEKNEETTVFGIGELVIMSNYLAPGYWKQPEKTRKVFIEDPIIGRGRVYRTRDLVRLHPDGEIEFVGRKDFQVKIRGFRIELGEIENQLLAHEAIKGAVVIDRTDSSGKKYLCAYIVADMPLSSRELKSFLANNLPDYMIPSHFVRLEKSPLTPSGKIDRTSLPQPEDFAQEVSEKFVVPRTKSDKIIANVWKEILHLDKVGLDDNFFELGGTSLDMIRLRNRLQELFRNNFPMATLMANPTIRFMAQYFHSGANNKDGLSQLSPKRGKTGTYTAVIGMAGRFPGARNLHQFWDNLKAGSETISIFLDDELMEEGIAAEVLQDSSYVKAKGYLEDIDYFDASFFDYSPREAEVMDPQLRFLHECAWEALENAGYNPYSYNGIIGFYTGAGTNLYWMSRFFNREGSISAVDRFAIYNFNSSSSYGTRIAYKLNLKGPSFSVQTACSTSLVSIHLACQGLQEGGCDIALAGGVSISLPQKHGYFHQDGMIHSADGHCRAFDADATGTVFGDGVGIVVLKPLNLAIDHGDSIHAVIKGSAINNDGSRKLGYTAPGIEGQTRVIREAIQNAGIEPKSISYIETHGTGTILGDPHEIEALKQAFNTNKKKFCKIGSVKTNVGHLDAAAGVTGFIKTVLALKHKLIPPSLHFETPNPEIDFDHSPFVVNTLLSKWERQENNKPLRAGVSSFGIGGTNAHVILEEAPAETLDKEGTRGLAPLLNPEISRDYQLILLSAKTETALEQMTSNLAEYFKKNPNVNFADVAYTLQVGRKAFNHRRILVCSDVNEAMESLSLRDPEKVQSHLLDEEEGDKQVVFMFSGQGSQYMNMGLELYQTESFFREQMDRCFEFLKSLMGYDIKEILYPRHTPPFGHPSQEGKEPHATMQPCSHASSEKVNETEIAQLLLFVFEYALAKLLMKWGIKPYAMIGHSIGEYVAACLSEVFSLEDALSLVVSRGQLMGEMPAGSMLGVSISEKELVPLLDKDISLAAVNSPSDCVVSGPFAAIDAFENQLAEKGIKTTRLHTSHAFHSVMMDPILNQFEQSVKPIRLNKPRVPYLSNLSGNWITVEQAADPGYWPKHMRQTVRFADGIRLLLKKKNTVFIEVGPGRTLAALVRKCMGDHQKQMVVNLVRHPRERVSDLCFLESKLGWLWLWGVEIDWQWFHAGEKCCRIPLPTYPFEPSPYWNRENMEKPVSADLEEEQKLITYLPVKSKDISKWFYVPSWNHFDLKPDHSGMLKKASSWLVFVDNCVFGIKLIDQLIRKGHDVITIRPGSVFTKEDDRSYTINPGEPKDYETLIAELLASDRLKRKIVHLWNIDENGVDETGLESFKKSQDLGFFSLLYLAQAIGKRGCDREYHIKVLVNRLCEVMGGEHVYPGKTTLLGPVKVIPQEYQNIRCSVVDIVLPRTESWWGKKMTDWVLAELVSETNQSVVAYRGNRRLVQTVEHVQLDTNEQRKMKFKPGGVYLITGGLGNIGLTVAEYLAKTWQAKLILTGRSHFPAHEQWETWLNTHRPSDKISGKIRKVKKILDRGSEVIIARADVTHLQEMEAVLTSAENRFGKLDGLLHAAGIAGEESMKTIKEISKEKCYRLFHPKISGLFVLEKILKGKDLDFCLLFSSVSSILGGIGLIAYSAANIFMDAFAQRQNQLTPFPWITINWDLWKFQEQENKTGAPGANLLALAMEPGEAIEALQYILSRDDVSQVIVSTGDLNTRSKQWIGGESPGHYHHLEKQESSIHLKPRPGLPNAYAAPGNKLERMIAHLWEDYFGIKGIGIHDNFFDLGATSLDLIRLNDRLKKTFKKELAIEKLFTYPTIHSLAGFLDQMADDKSHQGWEDIEMDRAQTVAKGKKRLKQRKMSVIE